VPFLCFPRKYFGENVGDDDDDNNNTNNNNNNVTITVSKET
jgi:hypothetical protein